MSWEDSLHQNGAMASRYVDVDDYLAHQGPLHAQRMRDMMSAISKAHPELTVTLAWNVPQVKHGKDYVAGISAAREWVSFSPWSSSVMSAFAPRLESYSTTANLVRIDLDREIDSQLFVDLIQARLAELGV